jgi:hypothetical protein
MQIPLFPWRSVVQSIPEIDIFFWINMLERANIAEVEFWMFWILLRALICSKFTKIRNTNPS